MDYMPLKDCLSLRLASVNLKGIVDSTFQRLSTHPQEKFEADLVRNGEWSKIKRASTLGQKGTFKSLSRGQKLWDLHAIEIVYSNTACWLVPFGNPFMLGNVHLHLDMLNRSRHLRSLISRFGTHISSMIVKIYCYANDQANSRMIANLLLELLSMDLPNLKKLVVTGNVDTPFLSCLRQGILPDLNKLEALDFASVDVYGDNQTCRNNQLCFPFLEKYGTQLKVIYCEWNFFSVSDMSGDLLKTLLPNVTFLETDANHHHLQAMEKLSQAGCKLEQLVFHEFNEDSMSFVNVIRAINYFAPTLTHLRLARHDEHSPDSSRTEVEPTRELEEMIPLPKLKKLSVSTWGLGIQRISDFIQKSCPALQQLCVDETRSCYQNGIVRVVWDKPGLARFLFGMAPKLSKIVFCGFNRNTMTNTRIILRRNDGYSVDK